MSVCMFLSLCVCFFICLSDSLSLGGSGYVCVRVACVFLVVCVRDESIWDLVKKLGSYYKCDYGSEPRVSTTF